jgi:hypothetical protein
MFAVLYREELLHVAARPPGHISHRRKLEPSSCTYRSLATGEDETPECTVLLKKQKESGPRAYDERGSFEVIGAYTGKRYRICKGDIFNIQELDDHGIQVGALCVTAEGVATGDINLAQTIALETF